MTDATSGGSSGQVRADEMGADHGARRAELRLVGSDDRARAVWRSPEFHERPEIQNYRFFILSGSLRS